MCLFFRIRYAGWDQISLPVLFYFPAVIPVAAATFTPFPLLAMLGLMKMREWREGKKELVSQEDLQDPMAEKPDVKQSESSQKLMPKMEINGIAA